MRRVTEKLPSLAALYGRPPLDCVIEVAAAVAADAAARPQRYVGLSPEIAGLLEGFRDLTGRDPAWPDQSQRSQHYERLSGKTSSEGHPQTCVAEVNFLDAAEAAGGTAESQGRQGFADGARTFQAYLARIDLPAVVEAEQRTGLMFQRACRVLASDGVAKAFGVLAPKGRDLSFSADLDTEAAALIEAITGALEPATVGVIPHYTFLVAQRLASARRATVKLVIDGAFAKRSAVLAALERSASSWARALRDFHADTVVRAWKYIKAAERPGESRQLGLPTNPAGWRLQLDTILDSLVIAAGGT